MCAVTGAARQISFAMAALALVAGIAVTAAPRAIAGGGALSGTCNPYIVGTLIPVPCFASSNSDERSGGSVSGGGRGGSATIVSSFCPVTLLDVAQAQTLGLSWPPPSGHSWALMTCLAGVLGAGPQAVLVSSATGGPVVTPQQLLVTALGELHVPHLKPGTAPPRGKDGLVGLPEWFWVAASSWHNRTVTVTAGPVWATVTAMPVGLTFRPGPGLGAVMCAGPGRAYDPRKQSQAQDTDCSYTYMRPSTGQRGNAYPASVTVTWRVTWTGSGGIGGVLDAALPVSVGFTVAVAQGEALVTNP